MSITARPARPAIPTLQQIRSERAKKAAATRKQNLLEELQRQAEQESYRSQLYERLTEEQQEKIEEVLGLPTCIIEDEYEQMLDEWLAEKTEEVAESIRNLLPANVNAKLILAAIETDNVTTQFDLGVYGMSIDYKEILDRVLLEDEFDGSKKPTREEHKQ